MPPCHRAIFGNYHAMHQAGYFYFFEDTRETGSCGSTRVGRATPAITEVVPYRQTAGNGMKVMMWRIYCSATPAQVIMSGPSPLSRSVFRSMSHVERSRLSVSPMRYRSGIFFRSGWRTPSRHRFFLSSKQTSSRGSRRGL